MKNIKSKLTKAMMSLFLVLTSLSINSSTVLAATSVVKGNPISGSGGFSVQYDASPSWRFSNNGPMSAISVNGDLAYCIEPMVAPIEAKTARSVSFDSLTEGTIFHIPGNENNGRAGTFKINNTQKRNIMLIANYGYGYPGHSTTAYHWATQRLIWKELGFTVTSSGSDVTNEMTNIMKLVSSHADRPSWHKTLQKAKSGETIKLSGANSFEFITAQSKGVSVTTSGDTFNVTVNDPKNATFVTRKKQGISNGASVVWADASNISQRVLVAKMSDPISAYIDFEPDFGKAELTKKDTSGNTISGAVFELSKNKSSILGTYTTRSNGKVTINDLEEGTYYVREKSVPSPLIVDTSWHEVKVHAGSTATYTATNKIAAGKIEVVKYGYNKLAEKLPRSLGDEYIVQGAQFDIKDGTGKVVDSITTGSNGKATSKELPLGKYTVVETYVPTPLVLDTTPLEANIVYKDQTTSVVIREVSQRNKEAVGQIEVIKKSIHGDLIKDAVFEIKDKDNLVVDTLTTDANGYAKSKELLLGKYTVKETSVPQNLVLEKTPIPVELTYQNQLTPVVVEGVTKTNDYQRSDLELTKVENDWDKLQPEFNNIKLSGAVLQLYAKQDILEGSKKIYLKDELIGQEVSDKHGNVKFHNLPIGEYYVKEEQAPRGYILHDGVWNISIKYDKDNPEVEVTTTESTLTNQIAYGRSKIHKTAKGGKKFLKDAKFGLYTIDGKKLGEFVTDAKGEFISPDLRFGKYYWQEIEAPQGYFTDNTKHHFEITVDDHEKIIHLPVDNEYIEMRLQVVKKDVETEKPLKDAVFEIHDENGEVVSFEYIDDKLEVQTQTQLVTNDKGIAVTRGFLKYGTYSLVEVRAPKGYLRQEPFSFTIDEKTSFVDLPVFGRTKTQEVSNQPTTVEIIKLSENSGEPLEGAHLQLIHKESKEVLLDWISDGEPVIFKGLYIDETYILREVKAPEGYFVAEDVEFTVQESRDVQTITMLDELIPEIKTQASFISGDKVNKVDHELIVIDTVSYKDLVIGKHYTVKGKLLDTETEEVVATAERTFIPEDANGEIDLEFTFDASKLLGSTLVVFEDLFRDERLVATHSEITDKNQTVYIPEIKTTASVSEFNKDSVTITDVVKYSDLETDREYTLVGWIMTKDGKPLQDKDGHIIDATIKFTPDKNSGEIEMDFTIPVELLNKGEFVVFEELYLDDKLVAEHKDLDDKDQTVTFIEIVIEKLDKESLEKLEGVEFTLFDEDGNIIESKLTNELGEVRFLVPKGKYTVKETKALDGYLLSSKNNKFKVKGNEENFEIKLVIKNKHIPELPNTGVSSTILFAGASLMIMGILLLIARKLDEYEEKIK